MSPKPNPAVIAFLNELGQAMRDQQAVALVAHERRKAARRAMDELARHDRENDIYQQETA